MSAKRAASPDREDENPVSAKRARKFYPSYEFECTEYKTMENGKVVDMWYHTYCGARPAGPRKSGSEPSALTVSSTVAEDDDAPLSDVFIMPKASKLIDMDKRPLWRALVDPRDDDDLDESKILGHGVEKFASFVWKYLRRWFGEIHNDPEEPSPFSAGGVLHKVFQINVSRLLDQDHYPLENLRFYEGIHTARDRKACEAADARCKIAIAEIRRDHEMEWATPEEIYRLSFYHLCLLAVSPHNVRGGFPSSTFKDGFFNLQEMLEEDTSPATVLRMRLQMLARTEFKGDPSDRFYADRVYVLRNRAIQMPRIARRVNKLAAQDTFNNTDRYDIDCIYYGIPLPNAE